MPIFTKLKPSVAFDPYVSFSGPNTVTVTGTAGGGGGIASVEVYAETGSGFTDLGPAQLDNGHWSLTDDLGAAFSITQFSAVATTVSGDTVDTTSPSFIYSGIQDKPYTSAQVSTSEADGSQDASFYGPRGALRYSAHLDHNGPGPGLSETGAAPQVRFVFATNLPQSIANFNAAGPGHDVLVLPPSDFAGIADVLRHTSEANGSATIHDPNGTTVTLQGVGKAELKAHPHDFAFHGDGSFGLG